MLVQDAVATRAPMELDRFGSRLAHLGISFARLTTYTPHWPRRQS